MDASDVANNPSPAGRQIVVVTSVTISFATLFVSARFWARLRVGIEVKEDDWLIVMALVMAWTMSALRFYAVNYDGIGYHKANLPPEIVTDFQKTFIAIQATYFAATSFTKASILLLYRRLFGVWHRFNFAVYMSLFLVAAYFICCILIACLGCRPVSYFWDKSQPGECIDETAFFLWNGVANLILDILILLLPQFIVWGLNLSFSRRLALCGIFFLGAFVCLASAFRIVHFQKSRQSDPTYTTTGTILWSIIEQTVGIVCACLPTLRPLLRGSFWRSHPRPVSPQSPSHELGEAQAQSTRSISTNATGVEDEDADHALSRAPHSNISTESSLPIFSSATYARNHP